MEPTNPGKPGNEADWLAQQFETHRGHLKGVAYRMLGSFVEADDAVQESWLRLTRSGVGGVENLGGWLTTVVSRVCLDMLRSRKSRREEQLGVQMPDPILSRVENSDPRRETELADSLGVALLVVLETLTPAERLAFVLHDMFAVSFNDIAALLECSPSAARQHASRARRRVQGATVPDCDLTQQRKVVDAYLVAARSGNFEALLEVLDPNVVARTDRGPAGAPGELHGAEAVAARVVAWSKSVRGERAARPILVNGAAGFVGFEGDKPGSVIGFIVRGGRIVEMNLFADPARLRRLDLVKLFSN